MFSKSVVSQACQSALTIEGINAVEEALRGDPELILAIQAAEECIDLIRTTECDFLSQFWKSIPTQRRKKGPNEIECPKI